MISVLPCLVQQWIQAAKVSYGWFKFSQKLDFYLRMSREWTLIMFSIHTNCYIGQWSHHCWYHLLQFWEPLDSTAISQVAFQLGLWSLHFWLTWACSRSFHKRVYSPRPLQPLIKIICLKFSFCFNISIRDVFQAYGSDCRNLSRVCWVSSPFSRDHLHKHFKTNPEHKSWNTSQWVIYLFSGKFVSETSLRRSKLP